MRVWIPDVGSEGDEDRWEHLTLHHGVEGEDEYAISEDMRAPSLWIPDKEYRPRIWRRHVTQWIEIPRDIIAKELPDYKQER